MRPSRLILTDWCQHESFEILFTMGMNAIQGPNGSGKSNILEALNLCLSQDTNSPGKKTDNIRNGMEKATVVMEFTHDDQDGVVKVTLSRNYRKSWEELSLEIEAAQAQVSANHEDPAIPVTDEQLSLSNFKPRETIKYHLEWGEVKLRKATEVAEFMREKTLLDPKIIKTNYFPRQGDVDGAMSADRDTRQKIFHEKAGTNLCQKMRDLLAQEVRDSQDFSGIDQQLEEAKARLAVAQGELKSATKQLETAQAKPQDASEAQAIIQAYMQGNDARQKIATYQEQISTINLRLQSLQAECDQLKEKGTSLREDHDKMEPLVEGWKQQLWSLSETQRQFEQRQQVEQQLEQIRAAIKGTEAPPPQPVEETRVNELREQVQTMRVRTQQLEQWLVSFASGTCPTCGQSVEGMVDKYQAELDGINLAETQAHLANDEQAFRAWQQAENNYRMTINRMEAQEQQLAQQLEQLPEVTAPQEGQKEELEKQLESFTVISSNLEQLRYGYNTAVDAYNAKKSELERTQALADQLFTTGQNIPTEEEFKAAGDLVSQVQLNNQELRDAQVAHQVAEKLVEDRQTDHDRLAAEAAKVGPSRTWSSMLNRARDLLHQNNWPQEVVAWYAEQLARHTQEHLESFDAGFQLAVSKDLDLLGIFPDKVMPAQRFSGGEKNIVNICLRLAMTDLFPSHLHLLVLDEVEVHLDQDKVACLPIILEKVKGLARNRGLVVLFISHHPSLRDVADHVIHTAA